LIAPSICNAEGAKSPFPEKYNVVWNSQSKNSSESMPVNAGSIACNVWVENGDLLFYVARSGSYDEHGALLKLGRVRLTLSPNPLLEATFFRQELKLHDGFIEIEGRKETGNGPLHVNIKLWVEVHRPVVHVDVDANQPVEVEAAYESWRTEEKELAPGRSYGERFAMFNLVGYPGKVIRVADSISFSDGGILFYHRNPPKKLVPEVLIEQQGLTSLADSITDDLKNRTSGGILVGEGFAASGKGQGEYLGTPFTSWKLRSEKARKDHRLLVVTHIEQAEQIVAWKHKLLELATEAGADQQTAFEKSVSWWHEFWDRSWIVISPDRDDPKNLPWQIARNYQLFRYQLGGNVHGEYPSKFNGGNLTFDPVLIGKSNDYGPDWRRWGGSVFTAQNQRLLYWPLLKSGDFDVILPQFELYRKGLPGATARVKVHFGHEGAVYCEYTSVPGIALGDGWGWKGGISHRQRGEEISFGDPRADALKGYGQPVEKGVMANPSISYHWESQVEHAYMILEYHRFTGADISKYLPFIKQSLIFFDKHYRLRQKMRNGKELDDKGKLVIYPSTACESFFGAKNPTDLCSGLAACLDSIAGQDVGFSKEDLDYFAGMRKRIPDISFGKTKTGAPMAHPAEKYRPSGNVECPQFYPLFPFNRYALGRDDLEAFHNAWKYGKFARNMVISWHQDGIFMARMGMTADAAAYNLKKLADSPRRFPTFWGPGHDWAPDHNWGGTGMLGLQEMLMQTVDDKIVLFPAWPGDWDVDFKLHAPRKTTVMVSVRNGKITDLAVNPSSRRQDVVILNDYGWPGHD